MRRRPQLIPWKAAGRVTEEQASADEVEDYKSFVVSLAQRVAEAHKEGGFLGVGGKEVGEAEQAALEEIKEALGA